MEAMAAAHPAAHYAWQIREDIVAQAVSIYMMRFQEFSHKIDGAEPENEAEPVYDGNILRRIVARLMREEDLAEAFFAKNALRPLRLSQDSALSADKAVLLRHLADMVGVPVPDAKAAESRHSKLGSTLNKSYAARLAEDAPAYLAEVAAHRAPLLARLTPLV